MERNVYKYNIEVNVIDIPSRPIRIEVNDEIENVLDFLSALPREERRVDLSTQEKVIYLEEYVKTEINNMTIYFLKFVSLKYNQTREVLNKDTLESKGRLKDVNDGDKEYNHIAIGVKNGRIKAAFEYNYYGIQGLGTIISYINDMATKYFKEIGIDKYYYLEAHNEVNREFLEELNKMRQINAATIVVASERFGNTEFGELSGREEIKDEIEITFKRAKRRYIPKVIIEEYYNKKQNGDAIKRIYVSGRNETNKIKLDTEEMKQKVKLSVSANIFGEIDSDNMFEQLKNYLMEENG